MQCDWYIMRTDQTIPLRHGVGLQKIYAVRSQFRWKDSVVSRHQCRYSHFPWMDQRSFGLGQWYSDIRGTPSCRLVCSRRPPSSRFDRRLDHRYPVSNHIYHTWNDGLKNHMAQNIIGHKNMKTKCTSFIKFILTSAWRYCATPVAWIARWRRWHGQTISSSNLQPAGR